MLPPTQEESRRWAESVIRVLQAVAKDSALTTEERSETMLRFLHTPNLAQMEGAAEILGYR